MAFFSVCAGFVRTARRQREGRLIMARNYAKHGLHTMKRALAGLGSRAIDRRTSLGRALAAWRADLVRELGGPGVVTTQQVTVIDIASRTKILIDSIDAWLLEQPSLVNKRRRALLPAVRERQQLADAMVKYMSTLGLERRVAETPDLSRYLAAKYPQSPSPAPPGAPTGAGPA
jgi:hypothetical protein